MVLGTGSPRREIRVTVTRDAVPRRSETLSHDAFVTSPSEPARGGPADRRSYDRDTPAPDDAAPLRIPVMAPELTATGHLPVPRRASHVAPDRTSVPFAAGAVAGAVAVAVAPAWAPDIADAIVTTGAPAGLPVDELPAPIVDTLIERILRGEHRAMV